MKKQITYAIIFVCTILGTSSLLFGIYRFKRAQNEIATNTNYTWSEPFTEYEKKVFFYRSIGLGCTVIGLIVLIIIAISIIYIRKRKRVIDLKPKQIEHEKYENSGRIAVSDVDNYLGEKNVIVGDILPVEKQVIPPERSYSEEENLKFARPTSDQRLNLILTSSSEQVFTKELESIRSSENDLENIKFARHTVLATNERSERENI